MEAARICNLSPSFFVTKITKLRPNHQFPSYGLKLRHQKQRCKNASVAEIMRNPEEEEWVKMGKSIDKCKERKGLVELLECLEREAIMGDDEGKEPYDYNRRAQIFDKSSRVFQALKEHSHIHSVDQSSL